jgi:hypothetical protein
MNTNNKPRRKLSEKAKEGRRRRQRERRRRQREQREEQCNNEYDFDDDDADADYYLDIFDDYYRRSNFIILDDKFNFLKKVDSSELHTKLAQIYSEHNSSVPSNLKTHAFNKTIKKLDEFIAQTPPTENIRDFQISGRDLYDGKKLYNTMKDDPEPNYEIFGSNSCGYTCFYLYKSNDKNMYIIVTHAHSDKIATHYVKIENENIFG